jgi:hypothetical protein
LILVTDKCWTGREVPDAMLCWEEFVELRNLHERAAAAGWGVSMATLEDFRGSDAHLVMEPSPDRWCGPVIVPGM